MELIFGEIRIRVKVMSDRGRVIEWENITMTPILGNFGHPCFGGLSVVSCRVPSCRCNMKSETQEDFGPSSYSNFPSEQMHVFLKMLYQISNPSSVRGPIRATPSQKLRTQGLHRASKAHLKRTKDPEIYPFY